MKKRVDDIHVTQRDSAGNTVSCRSILLASTSARPAFPTGHLSVNVGLRLPLRAPDEESWAVISRPCSASTVKTILSP